MFGWLFGAVTPSDMARKIATEFTDGKIVRRDLDGHGISSMEVVVSNVRVSLSWYSGGNPRSISIDGKSSMPRGVDSLHIFSAAKKRASFIIDEDLSRIQNKMNTHSTEA